jgi:hypothetical protein
MDAALVREPNNLHPADMPDDLAKQERVAVMLAFVLTACIGIWFVLWTSGVRREKEIDVSMPPGPMRTFFRILWGMVALLFVASLFQL